LEDLKGEKEPKDIPIEYVEDIPNSPELDSSRQMEVSIPQDLIDEAYEVIR